MPRNTSDRLTMPGIHLVLLATTVALLPVVALRGGAQAPPPQVLRFAPVADTYVDNRSPDVAFEGDGRLRAKAPEARVSYLRFVVQGIGLRPVQNAWLRLSVLGSADSGGVLHRISNGSWDPATMTWSTRVPVDGPALATLGQVSVGTVVEFDLGNAITGDGVYDFAIRSDSTDGVTYASSDVSGGQRPELVVAVPATGPSLHILQPLSGSRFYVGDVVTLQAEATAGDGADLGAGVEWGSDLQGVLGTGALLQVPLGPGVHLVSASVVDGQGLSATDRVDVTIEPPPVENTEPLVTITSPRDGAVVAAGAPVVLEGTASDLEDGTLTDALTWSSERAGVLGTGGRFAGIFDEGTEQITASVADSGGRVGSATVSVQVLRAITRSFPPVADAFVDAGAPDVNFGSAPILHADANTERLSYLRFVVSGIGDRTPAYAVVRLTVNDMMGAESPSGGTLYAISDHTWQEDAITYTQRPPVDGVELSTVGEVALGTTAEWDVSAIVAGDGTYDFVLANASSDLAEYHSRESTPAPALVLTLGAAPPVVTITGPSEGTVVAEGTVVTFVGVANDAEDGNLTDQITWVSSRDGVLGNGATVSRALSVGTHAVTAAVTDGDGLTTTSSVTVRVRTPNTPPTLTIEADPTSAPAGAPVVLQAQVTDDFDADLGGQVTWVSNRDGSLGQGASLSTRLSEGTHVVTARVTDSDGATTTAALGVTVAPSAPEVTITSPEEGARVYVGAPVVLAAVATDATDGDLSAQVRWVSDLSGPLGIGSTVTATGLAIGTHRLSATAVDGGGLAGGATRSLVVSPPNVPPTVAIVAPLEGADVLVDQPVLLHATALDPEDGDVGASLEWSSSRDGALGVGTPLVVAHLSAGTHVLTAVATDTVGATATATRTVVVGDGTLTVPVAADTYVDAANPTQTFGSASTMMLDGSPLREAYLRFVVSGLGVRGVRQARLRLTVGSGSKDGGDVGAQVYALADGAWSEEETTWNNRPGVGSVIVATVPAIVPGEVVEIDVTSVVTGDGTWDLALRTPSSNGVRYVTHEAGAGAPELVLTLRQASAPAVTIQAPTPGTQVFPDAPLTLSATATDAEDGDVSASIVWESDRQGVLGAGAHVTASLSRPGAHVLTARALDADGLSASASVTVAVAEPPLVTILAPESGRAIFVDQLPLALRAAAQDAAGRDLGPVISWSSDLDGPLGSGRTIAASALSVGSHVITASATDGDGLEGEARITVRVRTPNQGPTLTITTPTDGFQVPAGTPIDFAAVVTDDFDDALAGQVAWSSNRAGSLGTGATRTLLLGEGVHVIEARVADSDGAVAVATITVAVTPSPPVVTIATPADGSRVVVGTPVLLAATVVDATDGDLSGLLRWTSDLDGPLGVGASVTTVLGEGRHTITATAVDTGGILGSSRVTLDVRAPNVPPTVAIVSPTNGSTLLAGQPLEVIATARDAEDGQTLDVRWSSSRDGQLATGPVAIVTGLSVGFHVLSVEAVDGDGAVAQAQVDVTVVPSTLYLTADADTYVDAGKPGATFGLASTLAADASPTRELYVRFTVPPVGDLTIARAELRLRVGDASADGSAAGGSVHSMTAGAWDEASTTYDTRPPVDGPEIEAIAGVVPGQVVAVDVTSAIVTPGTVDFALVSGSSDKVAYASREASAGQPVLVLTLMRAAAPVVAITNPLSGSVLPVGAPVTLAGLALDTEGSNLSGQIVWTSSRDGALGTGAAIVVPALTPGEHRITARVQDTRGDVGEAEVVVEVGHRPVVTIRTPADGTVVSTADLPVTLEATAVDAEDGDVAAGLTWTSDLAGVLGSGPTVHVGVLALGRHLLTAAVTDADGRIGQATVAIQVRAPNVPPVVAIARPLAGSSFPAGTLVTFAAAAGDDFDGDVSDRIVWSSDRDGVLGTGASLDVPLGEGVHHLTARVTDSDGAAAFAGVDVTITATPPVVVVDAPLVREAAVGAVITFAGTAFDATDGDLSAQLTWTSDRDGLLGIGARLEVDTLSAGVHVITAAATDAGGLTGSVSMTLELVHVPSVAILLPEPESAFLRSTPITFMATASDRADGDVSASIVWVSDRDGEIGRGASITVVTGLSEGRHVVTASARNGTNHVGTATVEIVIGADTLVFTPVADTYVDAGSPDQEFGAGAELMVGTSPSQVTLLRFAVEGVGPFPVADARLELTVGTSSSAAGGAGGTLQVLTDGNWSEGTTYATRPGLEGAILDAVAEPVAQRDVVRFDARGAIDGDGPTDLGVTSASTNSTRYGSRESDTPPRLVVTLGQPDVRGLPHLVVSAPVPDGHFFDDEVVTLAATAVDSAGVDLSGSLVWESDLDGALGVGGTLAVPHLSRGVHVLTATARDAIGLPARGSVTVHVEDRPPELRIVAPADGQLFAVGFPITLSATAVDDVDGDLGEAIAWSSDRDGALGHGTALTVEQLSTGEHRISAAVSNSFGTANTQTIAVFVGSAPPAVTILAPVDGGTVPEGTVVTLAGTASDLEDGDLSAAITWESDLAGPLGTGAERMVTLDAAGTHRLTATVNDSHGLVRATSVLLTVTAAPPTVAILAPAATSLHAGPVTFLASATDFRDGELSSGLRWWSSVDGLLGFGPTLERSLRPGTHLITADVTDSDGQVGTASVALVVGDVPPTVSILTPEGASQVAVGTTVTLHGSASDDVDGDLSAGIAWASDVDGPLGTGAAVDVVRLTRGTHVLTASARDHLGQSGQAQIRIDVVGVSTNTAPVVTIVAPATDSMVMVGEPVAFVADVVDDSGQDLRPRLSWVSDLDGLLGTGASFATSTLAVGTHVIRAVVSDSGGLIGSSTVRVMVMDLETRFAASADAYTDSLSPAVNFGFEPSLKLDDSPRQRIYLRFVVSGFDTLPVARVVLRLHALPTSSAGGEAGGDLFLATDPTWEESTITDENKPLLDGVALASAGPVDPDQAVEFDVTSLVTGDGTYQFGLRTDSRNGVEFASREAGDEGPALVVVHARPLSTRPHVRIVAPADRAPLAGDAPVILEATAVDAQGGDLSGAVVWESDRDGVLGTGAVLAAALSRGIHALTARVTDAGGSAADRIHVSVGDAAPGVTILVPTDGATVPFGASVLFTGTAFDDRDGDLAFEIAWASDVDGPLGTGPALVRALSPGTHVVSATATDREGLTGRATATVHVRVGQVGYRDAFYGAEIEQNLNKATASKPEDKLWYTDDGVWWATLYVRDADAYHIHRLDFPTQTWLDTGVLVDERGTSRQDVLWEAATRKLYMASRFADDPAEARLLRYTYHSEVQQFTIDPGFPVVIPGGGTEALTLAKDTTGTLWVAFTLQARVWITHSLGSDMEWSAALPLPVDTGTQVAVDDIASVIALPGQIGVFWSNQVDEADYFAVHTDGLPAEDPLAWRFEVAVASSRVADDHLHLRVTSTGRLFAAIKTSQGGSGQTMLGLLERSPVGVWSPLIQVATTDFSPTRPHVLIDEVARRLHVFYSISQMAVYRKSANLDAMTFEGGVGTPFIVAGTDASGAPVGGINNPTSTKQPITAATGLVVLASSDSTHEYWHNTVDPLPIPTVTITVPATGTTLRAGMPVTFTGSARGLHDGDLTATLAWETGTLGVIGLGGTFTTTVLPPGAHEIRAWVVDNAGVTGQASITVRVVEDLPPDVAIATPGNGDRFLTDHPITFVGTALDSLDGDLASTLVWSSDRDGALGTGSTIVRTDLSPGRHVIEARATDTSGATAGASIAIDVVAPSVPTVTLLAPVDGLQVAFGARIGFAARATDPFDGDLTASLAWSSDRDGALGTGGEIERATLSIGVHVITVEVVASSGLRASASTTVAVLAEAPPVVEIVTPDDGLDVAVGRSVSFTARALDELDGEVSPTIVWQDAVDGVLGAGPALTVSTLTIGEHRVTATASDGGGRTGTAVVTVRVHDLVPPVVIITSPADATRVLFADQVLLAATAVDAVDGDVGADIAWTSDRDGLLGTGRTFGTRGLGLGAHTITATARNSDGLTAESRVTIEVVSGPQIAIFQPTDMTVVSAGLPLTFMGLAFDFEDGELSEALRWTSDRDGVLGVGGTVTATLSAGTHVITASATDQDGYRADVSLAVEVRSGPIILVVSPADGTLVTSGIPLELTAFATDPEDGILAPALRWSSDRDGALGTGATIMPVLSVGSHTVSAEVSDSDGLSARATVAVVVDDPPRITIDSPAPDARLVWGEAQTLTASAVDPENGDLGDRIAWSSDRQGWIGTGRTIEVTYLALGAHVLTASVADAHGLVATDTRTIMVFGRPQVTILSPPDGTRATLGDTVTFTGSASDPEDGKIGSTIEWRSPLAGPLGTGTVVTLGMLEAGAQTIIARVTDADGLVGEQAVSILVDARPEVRIVAPAEGTLLEPGTPLDLVATASDLEDGDLSERVLWFSDQVGVLGSGAVLRVPGLPSGTHRLTALVGDDGGHLVMADVSVVVSGRPTVVITAPVDGTVQSEAIPITLEAIATDPEDGVVSSAIAWESDLAGPLGHGERIAGLLLTPGVHTITATVADTSRRTTWTQVMLTVIPAS